MDSPPTCLVDTLSLLDTCLDDIASPLVRKLAIDLEGVDLCRTGRISLLQIYADTRKTIWLIDVTTLGSTAFEHQRTLSGHSLKSVLESSTTVKLLFDVRNDSDALYNLYKLNLTNVYDLQLAEVAVRRSKNLYVKTVSSLARTIQDYVRPPLAWTTAKEQGAALFRPENGGSFEVFECRPLDPLIIRYAAQDVSLLFQLEECLKGSFGSCGKNWESRIFVESMKRVQVAWDSSYLGNCKGRHRALAPKF